MIINLVRIQVEGIDKQANCALRDSMSQSQSGSALNPDELNRLSKEELVQIILTQQKLIEEPDFSRDLELLF